MDPAKIQSFADLLLSISSEDKQIREPAQETFTAIPLLEKTELLINLLSTSEIVSRNNTVAISALIYMRKTVSDPEIYKTLNANGNALSSFKSKILEIIELHSELKSNPKYLADVLTDTHFSIHNNSDEWPESLELVSKLAAREHTLPIVLHCMIALPSFVEKMSNGKIVNLLSRSLNSEDYTIETLAARATCAYLSDCKPDDLEAIMGFGALLPQVMRTIVKSVVEHDDDSVIKEFIDVVETEKLAPLLKSGFDKIITLSLKIIAESAVSDENKQLSLEVIITLVETFPGMIRKLATTSKQAGLDDPIEGTIQACVYFIQQIEDDDDWITSDAEDDTDFKSNTLSGESALDRLSCALRGGIILPRITSILPGLMASSDWQSRYASLTAIGAIAEGCHAQMIKILPDVLKQVLVFTRDTHPRVRYSAANCLGQLSIDFGKKFTKLSHDKVIPEMVNLLDDQSCPKVIGQACGALINFVESLSEEKLEIYQKSLLNKIEINMNREASMKRRFTLQQLVTLLAAVAGQMDTKFEPYFEKFMPGLNEIIQSTINVDEYSKLRGKSIECFSIIGLAVGKEKFTKYAKEFMETMLKLQLTPEMWQNEDETISYTISAWARMSKLLGADFAEYLPQVMPPLLTACKISPEVSVMNENEASNLDEEKWQCIRLPGDDSQLGIKTSGLELKATACSMLVCYCREVGDTPGFKPYLDEIVKLAKELLKFYFHEDVRVHAGEILNSVITHHGIHPWHGLDICKSFISSISEDPEIAVVSEMMELYANSIESLLDNSEQIFVDDDLQKTFDIVETHLKNHLEKSNTRREERKTNDLDDGDEEELIEAAEEDEFLLAKVADVMHAVIGTQKQSCLPLYNKLHPYFVQLLNSEIFTDRQWALCVFCDIIERFGSESLGYSSDFLQHIIDGIEDEMGEVRQACAYAIGAIAKSTKENNLHGSIYDKVLKTSLQKLNGAIQNGIKEKQKDDNIEDPEDMNFSPGPWENCISAIGKIMRYRPDILSLQDGFDHWLEILDQNAGLQEDEEEAENVFEFMNELMRNQSNFMTENNRLVKFVSLVGDLLVSGLLEETESQKQVRDTSISFLGDILRQDKCAFQQMTFTWDDNKKCLVQDKIGSF